MFEVFRKIFRVYFSLFLGSYVVFFVAGALFTAVMMLVLVAQGRSAAAFETFSDFAMFALFVGFIVWVRRDIHEQNRLRELRRHRQSKTKIVEEDPSDEAADDSPPSEGITRRPGN
jgi:cytosine/uracil/thiamine/allantoin permease